MEKDGILFEKLNDTFAKHIHDNKENPEKDWKDIVQFSSLALGCIVHKNSLADVVWNFQECLKMALDAPKTGKGYGEKSNT